MAELKQRNPAWFELFLQFSIEDEAELTLAYIDRLLSACVEQGLSMPDDELVIQAIIEVHKFIRTVGTIDALTSDPQGNTLGYMPVCLEELVQLVELAGGDEYIKLYQHPSHNYRLFGRRKEQGGYNCDFLEVPTWA